MEMVVRESLEKHFEYCKQLLNENPIFKEFMIFSKSLGYSVNIRNYMSKSWGIEYYFLSVYLTNDNNEIVVVDESSEFYDDLGSPGGSECIMPYNPKKDLITKAELTNELFDDLVISNKYLKGLLTI